MSDQIILFEEPAPGVARLVLNRPEARNAQSYELIHLLSEAFDRAAHDDQIKVIILAAAGPDFSSGHDLRELRTLQDDKPYEKYPATSSWGGFGEPGAAGLFAREQELYLQMTKRWRNLPKPTIAQVHGKCIAGGLMLAWACDLIIASEDAQFSDPVVQWGVCGVEWFAHPWELGPRKAKELLYTADSWSAQEAREFGMVNHVVSKDSLSTFTLELAKRISAKPAFGLRMTKEAVNRSMDIMGQTNAIESVFALHHVCHSFARDAGMSVASRPADKLLSK